MLSVGWCKKCPLVVCGEQSKHWGCGLESRHGLNRSRPGSVWVNGCGKEPTRRSNSTQYFVLKGFEKCPHANGDRLEPSSPPPPPPSPLPIQRSTPPVLSLCKAGWVQDAFYLGEGAVEQCTEVSRVSLIESQHRRCTLSPWHFILLFAHLSWLMVKSPPKPADLFFRHCEIEMSKSKNFVLSEQLKPHRATLQDKGWWYQTKNKE